MEEMKELPRRGRPPGKGRYQHSRSMRFSDLDAERLRRLAHMLETTEGEVIRRAVRMMARREELE